MFEYEVIKECKQTGARIGKLTTPHGVIETPVFMPVGTLASVKGLSFADLNELGTQIMLSNTYHLYLKPGADIVKKAGGLHNFMHWNKPILTDSGGFQVFSLSSLRKIDEEGVCFSSHLDGSKHMITPEKSMEIQKDLGSDIVMAFDFLTEAGADYQTAKAAMEKTLRWLDRCKNYPLPNSQMLFPIIQGNMYEVLRIECAKQAAKYASCGIAVGGLSVGEEKSIMYRILDVLRPHYPQNMPRYLMGVGSPDCIIEGVIRGIDMFDCVLPTRIARNGTAMTEKGNLTIRNAAYKEDFAPVEKDCDCFCCRNYSRSYVRHLLNVGEMQGGRLLSMHNIRFLHRLTNALKEAIREDRSGDFRDEFMRAYRI